MRRKAALSIFLALITLFSCITASAGDTDSEIASMMEEVHSEALGLYKSHTGNSSFHGNCGVYISYLLNALGIDNYLGGHNGNQWYDAYSDGQKLGEYRAVKFPGGDCLYDITKKYGDISNVILSFPHQTGYSYENPGAGHVLFIHRIKDGKVYFTESYGMYGVAEGRAHIMSIETLLDIFTGWYGDPIGAVWMKKDTAVQTQSAVQTTVPETTKAPSLIDKLVFDEENGIVKGLAQKTDISELADVLEGLAAEVLNADGTAADIHGYISTGMSLVLSEAEKTASYVVAVAGDIDGNGLVSSSDARTVLRIAAGLISKELSPFTLAAGDVNDDDRINSSDARNILRIAAHIL